MAIEDKRTDAFFRQCVREGCMTQTEYEELRLDHYSAGTRPEWERLSDYYVTWCNNRKIDPKDVEIYLNSETWTQDEIAEHLNIDRNKVRRALDRIYRAIPELGRFRGNGKAVPRLKQMVSIEVSDMNGNSIVDTERVRERF